MPSLLACFGCGGKGEADDVRMLDYRHCGLTDVPSDVFASERTLEELLLDSNQLTELPRQLFHCHGLRELGLSDNELCSLPPAVASLINLTSIDLSKNGISDIPDNIKGCKQLAVVDASINPLCRLPEGFTQLLSLQELYLNDTFLEYLPANFGRLSKLKILELRENQLNTLPKSIARLTNLQRLDIGQNDFSELPEVIGSLGSLTELLFDNNKVKSLPPLMGRLTALVHVDASKNKVDWVAGDLENCTALTDLHLSSNNLKELPESLGGCTSLQLLRLDDNALTHLPESLGGLASLQELVVTQNDVESLPASIGLLRALHTLHVDDNLLTELPPEIGSCTKLTVLTAASNRLLSVPAELGHLPNLVVLNLCDNLIPHLPVSLTKLKLRALWLSENQNKPQVQLQSETLDTGQRVLTCFMLPQQERDHQPAAVVEGKPFPGKNWDEQRRAKSLIKFAFDGDVDKPGRLTRAPTPYPKELKALAKHARNLHTLQKDGHHKDASSKGFVDGQSKGFVLGRVEEGSKVSVAQPKVEVETSLSRKGSDSALRQPLLDPATKEPAADEPCDPDDPSTPLTVVETQADERPQLREARTVRNGQSANTESLELVSLTSGVTKTSGIYGSSKDLPYTIGDRKVVGHAQVVAMGREKPAADTPRTPVIEDTPTPSPDTDNPEDALGDTPDKRIKKPPPYHIAAVMSRHAADFHDASVEVSGVSSPQGTAAGLTVKDLATSQQTSSKMVSAEDDTNDTSSSSDSGYGNGKTSSQQTAEEQRCSDGSATNSPTSPQHLIDSSLTMATSSTATSPTATAPTATSPVATAPTATSPVATSPTPISPTPISPTANSLMATSPAANFPTSPLATHGSYMTNAGLRSALYTASHDRHSYAGTSLTSSIPSSPPSLGLQTSSSNSSAYSTSLYSRPQNLLISATARPASIAVGQTVNMHSSHNNRPGSLSLGMPGDAAFLGQIHGSQRPGSLASPGGSLATPALYAGRPGSLAAPINTLGIPPAPARAMSHMALHTTSPSRPRDPAMFRSQDLTRPTRGWSAVEDKVEQSPRRESNGLVSIIDQVTSSFLEHGESPPPKTPVTPSSPSTTFPVTSLTTTTTTTPTTASSHYSFNHEAENGITAAIPEPEQTPESYLSSEVRNRSSISYPRNEAAAGNGGLANFTQDQPRGEVLHPTPHRPHVLSLSEGQGSSHELGEPQVGEPAVSPPRTAPKPQSRIPTFSPEGYPTKPTPKLSLDSQLPSHHPSPALESRIPSLGSVLSSPLSDRLRESPLTGESRIPSLSSMGRSPSNLSHDTKAESRIPAASGQSSSNLNAEKAGESRIPSLGSQGRSASNLTRESHINPDSRIPSLGMTGRSPSNLTRDSLSSFKTGHETTSKHSSLITSQRPSMTGMNGSGIPSLMSQGRSNSTLGSSITSPGSGIPSLASQGRSSSNLGTSQAIPSPGSNTTNLRAPLTRQDSTDSKKTLAYSGASHTSLSRLQQPSYSTGIRPPSYSSPSSGNQHPPGTYSASPGYSSGIRPPSVNSAINTPGIPIPSSVSLTNPGSRSSITSTGSGSRIPMTGGNPSRLPAPGTNKHRVSPNQTPENNKTNSAWMFGQHKNARVFPVVIEKNPGLGFTIGRTESEAEDKSIYVTSVAGGGAASSALKVGDKLLQVDGLDLRLADLHSATSILNKTSNTVNLMVSRLQ